MIDRSARGTAPIRRRPGPDVNIRSVACERDAFDAVNRRQRGVAMVSDSMIALKERAVIDAAIAWAAAREALDNAEPRANSYPENVLADAHDALLFAIKELRVASQATPPAGRGDA